MKGFRPNFKPKQKEKTPVVIAILTMEQNITTGIMQFVIHCLGQNSIPDCPYVYSYCLVENYRPVEYARNLAVREFRKITDKYPPTTKLLFIDADMVPPVNYPEQLAIDADMGAGRVYGIFDHQLFGCIQRCVDNQLRHLAIDPMAGNTIDVDASGTGGLWISKKVLDDKSLWLTPEGDVFQTLHEPDGQVKKSEDLDFTHRATKAGHTLKANLGVRWAHYKKVDLRAMEGKAGASEMANQLAQVRALAVENAEAVAANVEIHPFKAEPA